MWNLLLHCDLFIEPYCLCKKVATLFWLGIAYEDQNVVWCFHLSMQRLDIIRMYFFIK